MSKIGPISSSDGRKPGTPIIGTATAGVTQASVEFTAPSYTGKPNSSLTYTAKSSPSDITATGSSSPIVVTGLGAGTAYTFSVKLNNTVMDSDFSASSNSVTPTAPGPFFPPFFPYFPFFPPYFPFFPPYFPFFPFFPPYFPTFEVIPPFFPPYFPSFSVTGPPPSFPRFSVTSDSRDKINIEPLSIGVDFVNDLKPVTYTWNMRDGSRVNIDDFGFIAQNLAQVEDSLNAHEMLKLTNRENDDQITIDQERLIPILIKAVQELSAKLEDLKNE